MSKDMHQFAVRVRWKEEGRGLMAREGEEQFEFSSPKEFAGEDVGLTPEHMFVGSISSCHMLTFLFFIKKIDINLKAYHADAVGTVEKGPKGYFFSKVTLNTTVTVGKGDRDKTTKALEKGHKYCLVTNSIKCPVETVFEINEG